jgi:hypothetical protein
VATSSEVDADKLKYLGNVREDIQSQIDAHTHSDLVPLAGATMNGALVANTSSTAALTNPQMRNIHAGITDMTPGTSTLATGSIFLVYEE